MIDTHLYISTYQCVYIGLVKSYSINKSETMTLPVFLANVSEVLKNSDKQNS